MKFLMTWQEKAPAESKRVKNTENKKKKMTMVITFWLSQSDKDDKVEIARMNLSKITLRPDWIFMRVVHDRPIEKDSNPYRF